MGSSHQLGVPLQASDKRKALEETMALSTQSLASVTYQISSLATAFLRLLDLQAAELRKVEADVSCVAQVGPSPTGAGAFWGWVLKRGWALGRGAWAAGGGGDPPYPWREEPISPRSIALQWKCKTLSLGGGGGHPTRNGGVSSPGAGNWSLGCPPSLGA